MRDSPAAILISLKPQFADAIERGTKTIELRRRFPAAMETHWLVVYVTKPVGAVVAMVRIEAVVQASVGALWSRHRNDVGISRSTFFEYFSGCSTGYAVSLGEYRPVGPLTPAQMARILPGFRPPQSYRYIGTSALHRLRTPTRERSR